MEVAAPFVISFEDPTHTGEARRAAVQLAASLGFDEEDRSRVAIVATELATNLARHAQGDRWLQGRATGARPDGGVELLSIDRGPGIDSVGDALRDGFSTGGGPGQGLGAVRRLSDVFDLVSEPTGTVTLARLFARERATPEPPALGVVLVPKRGEVACGDNWDIDTSRANVAILVSDGLGHGPAAADASREAVASFRTSSGRTPEERLAAIHAALTRTRGAAVALAEIDGTTRLLRYVGLGNIHSALVGELEASSLVSLHGTAGHTASRIRAFEYPVAAGAILVMHSDGLSARWNLHEYPGLLRRDPAMIAAVLFRDFSRGRDDSCVVAYRIP